MDPSDWDLGSSLKKKTEKDNTKKAIKKVVNLFNVYLAQMRAQRLPDPTCPADVQAAFAHFGGNLDFEELFTQRENQTIEDMDACSMQLMGTF